MDSANMQTALVAEVTQGTIVATPSFLVCRETRVSGSPQRGDTRSPERRADRQEHNSVKGVNVFNKTIEMPWVRDAATDVLWASLFGAAFVADVIKNGQTKSFFTLEQKYEGGATDPYRRLRGCMVDSVSIGFRMDGSPGTLSWAISALEEETQAAAIAGATYAAPSPGYDPVSGVDVLVNDAFSVMSLTPSPSVSTIPAISTNITIRNNLRQQYAMGSASPFGLGLGFFEVTGSTQIYFSQLSDYSTFVTPQNDLTLDLTIGGQTNYKDRLVIPAARVSNPDVDDPGQSGDNMVTLNFRGRYSSGQSASLKLTRLVA